MSPAKVGATGIDLGFFMQLRCALLACVVGLMLGGCVTTPSSAPSGFAPPAGYVPLDQIQIVDRFMVVEVNAANLGAETQRCVPQIPAGSKSVIEAAAKLPLPRGTITGLSHLSSGSMLVISGSRAICIRQSAAHYPIFAAEAFVATINPTSVPPTVTDGWYAQIARRMAEAGRVTVAYVFTNGNADIASYWVEPTRKYWIRYAREFRKAGSWETGTYDFRFSHPSLTSISMTKRGANSSMVKVDLIANQ